ncbi:MAG TPA: cold shock domain-containing protein [Rhizomicrobium sp.]|jgi:CspA family cold shock protein|nr:cold shock domain-containing protein [Rhizomicrobium sp.]
MTTGTIKFFNASKGFGFVTPDGGSADIFLPAATLTACGIAMVNPGQRVAFEQVADKKGPKVVALQLLGEPVVKALAPAPERVKVYCDPSSDVVADVLSVIRAAGYQLQLLDYIATPLGQDQLRALSHLLSGSGKSLVRRHDPLFSALRLDDRFIGDQDFWTAIAEHPTLIDGPVLVLPGKARVCKSPEDARQFLDRGGQAAAPKPKTLSPRIAALIRGEPLAALSEVDGKGPDLPPQPLKSSAAVRPMAEVPAKPKRKIAAKSRAAKAEKKKSATKNFGKPAKKPKK